MSGFISVDAIRFALGLFCMSWFITAGFILACKVFKWTPITVNVNTDRTLIDR
jgi:hypothetical protein